MFTLMSNAYSSCTRSKVDVTIGVFGPYKAGKTTMLHVLQKKPVEEVSEDTCFQVNEFHRKKFAIKAFDLGGKEQFRDVWKTYYAEIHGLVFVVDASSRENWTVVKNLLWDCIKDNYIGGKPVLILANKQDQTNAQRAKEISQHLQIDRLSSICKESAFYVAETTSAAADRRGVTDAFDWLLAAIWDDFGALSSRRDRDFAEWQALEAQRKREIRERNRKRREEREREKEKQQQNVVLPGTVEGEEDADAVIPLEQSTAKHEVADDVEVRDVTQAEIAPLGRGSNRQGVKPSGNKVTLPPVHQNGGNHATTTTTDASDSADKDEKKQGEGSNDDTIIPARTIKDVPMTTLEMKVGSALSVLGGTRTPSDRSILWKMYRAACKECWKQLIKQARKGKRFSMDRLAVQAHAGWSTVAKLQWDRLGYGPPPPPSSIDPEKGWVEDMFQVDGGYALFRERKEEAEMDFDALTPSAKEKYRIVAEVLLDVFLGANDAWSALRVKHRQVALFDRLRSNNLLPNTNPAPSSSSEA